MNDFDEIEIQKGEELTTDTMEEAIDHLHSEGSPAENSIGIPDNSDIQMTSPGKSKGLADLAALKKLFKLKLVIAISAGVFFLILLLFTVLTSKETEVKFEYIEPKCTTMTVTFRHGSQESVSLSLENYVESMVYSLTKNMSHPKRVLYQAIAVAIRTQAQTMGTCSIEVNDEVDGFYEFSILRNDNSRYSAIHSAVGYVRGQVMVLDNDFVQDVDFDSFCYKENVDGFYTIPNQYTGPKIPTSWAETEISDFHFRECECNFNTERSAEKYNSCWEPERYPKEVELDENGEEIIYYLYVDGGDEGHGLSVYTAYYLSGQPGYDDEEILRFFYPGKWDYYTVDVENAKELEGGDFIYNGTLDCSTIDFTQTPLSREEFISKVTGYLSGRSSQTARLFIENAGEIYDRGRDQGVNPEMIYLIVEKEYGFKDTVFTIGCNNFYGMGVYNGASSGTCWPSFMTGIDYMLNYIKNKGSLDAFTKVYSYLGTYLANPGSAGDGGCYYLTLPEIYGANYSRCNSSYRCASSNGGAGCVLTTDAEKQAYIDWQASKILAHRSRIFGISEENCSVNNAFGTNVGLGDAGTVNGDERLQWLFPSGPPKSASETSAYLTDIQVPVVDINGNRSTRNLTVHKKLAVEVMAIFEEMANIGFPISDAGGYSFRYMDSGSGNLSHHAYGAAIDINANYNIPSYWEGENDPNSPYYINSEVVAIWKKHGFYWGGNWSQKYYDPMHFTYTNH